MPGQVIPIQDLASTGVILDTPSVSLPPNAFSNVENVRFHDGAVRKMTGESEVFTSSNVDYVAYWQAPSNNYYVVVQSDGDVLIYNANDLTTFTPVGSFTENSDAVWNHTEFNGGFHFILNNGVSTPQYLSDPVSTRSLAELPNWASYQSQEETIEFTFDGTAFGSAINLGEDRTLTVGEEELLVTVTPRNGDAITTGVFRTGSPAEPTIVTGTIAGLATLEVTNNVLLLTPAPTVAIGDTVRATIRVIPALTVSAGVVRAYGNLLVAGNLVETSSARTKVLPGLIRTSDVAAPGNIPLNWNPFQVGVNTADEFILASTGCVKDMVELQGVLYVYTDQSIHAVQQTGNPALPFQISPVTDSWGADNTGSIMEVDGKHIVVGSDDVYVFAGHPGSISSISDSRVRRASFFNTPGQDVQMVRFQKYDELWFWSSGVEEMFIWNYRDNTWTRRMMTAPVSGNSGPDGPIFAEARQIYSVDTGFSTLAGPYRSFVERRRLALAPEFDTETLGSVALLYSGTSDLLLDFNTSNAPGAAEVPFVVGEGDPFEALTAWKTDIRVTGRFLNYRIGDNATDAEWNITGMQFDIGKGGTR